MCHPVQILTSRTMDFLYILDCAPLIGLCFFCPAPQTVSMLVVGVANVSGVFSCSAQNKLGTATLRTTFYVDSKWVTLETSWGDVKRNNLKLISYRTV